MSTWWRRNRWALLALPFVLLLAAGAGSYRIWNFWNPYQLTAPVEGRSGEPVAFSQELEAVDGPYEVALTLTATDPVVVDHFTDATGQLLYFDRQEGSRVWRTDLTVTADPDVPLTGCQVRLVDAQGRETAYLPSRLGADSTPSIDACVPEGAPGPVPDLGFGTGDPGAPDRPETYTVPVYVRTADDFTPARIDIWWEKPEHLAITLHPEED